MAFIWYKRTMKTIDTIDKKCLLNKLFITIISTHTTIHTFMFLNYTAISCIKSAALGIDHSLQGLLTARIVFSVSVTVFTEAFIRSRCCVSENSYGNTEHDTCGE